jgi:hypothetical protein
MTVAKRSVKMSLGKNEVSHDGSHYKSDSIKSGRKTKEFLTQLSENLFRQSKSVFDEWGDMPILWQERNMYSTFAVAINTITEIHCSEYRIDGQNIGQRGKKIVEGEKKKDRIVDFRCLHNDVHYMIELKYAWYCISEGTCDEPIYETREKLEDLLEQIKVLTKIKKGAQLSEKDCYVGVMLVKGGYHHANTPIKESEQILYDVIVKNPKVKDLGLQVFSSTWHLPDDIKKQVKEDEWKYITEWISIFYFVYSKKE